MQTVLKYIFVASFLAAMVMPAYPGRKTTDSASDVRKAEVLYMEALVKRVEGDNASFYDLIQRAYELDPGNSIIAYYYGYALLMFDNQQATKVEEGLRLMKSHFDSHPEDFYENYLYALVCNQAGKKDEAIAVWEKLLSIDPGKVQVYPLLADGYAGKGELQKAIAAYDSLERSEGRSSAISVRKIGYMLALNDTAAALAEGRSLLKDAPRNFSYNMLMGDVFMQLADADSAMVYYDKAQKIEPDNGYVYLSKANVYSNKGDSLNYEREINSAIVNKNLDVDVKIRILTNYIRQCIEENDSSARVDNMFKVVIGQHPHEGDILKLYCDYLTFKRDYKEAAEQLSYALDINPTDVKSWERLMWLYIYVDEPQKAVEAGDKALSYNPDELSVYQIMATAYFQSEDYEKSLATYQLLLEKNKDVHIVNESDIYSGMAEVYNKLGDSRSAFGYYEKAIELSPNNYLALNNYAYSLCIAGGDLEKAERMSKIAVDADPENVSFLDTYAWICFMKRDYKQALEYIERAMSENGDDDPSAEMFEHYGDILFMNGDPEGALREWKKALDLNPESELLKRKVENKTYFYE